MKVVFIGSHLGYPMDRTPLGGGAMVGLRLLRHWSRERAGAFTVLGSGPVVPAEGFEYVRLPPAGGPDLVRLSEFEYARFCREFESATTRWLLANRGRFAPEQTCVLVNDVSEGPTLARLAAAGYPIVSLWHVDVVDYFNKLYLRGLVAPQRLTALYERCLRAGLSGAVPDLLRIVFEKQSETVRHSDVMIVPSHAMGETLARCYAELPPGRGMRERMRVVPWGAWDDGLPQPAPERVQELREHYQIGSQTTVIMTLSRISPEKGIHLLIEALRLLEQSGRLPGPDVVLFVCGEAAFMQGAAYQKRVRAAARALRRARVFFPGYLDGPAKKAYFRLAHLFVSPSVHESYGLNVVEAMQAGLAVLASDHYGVRDILGVAQDCAVVAPYPDLLRAPQNLARALEQCLRDRGQLERMGLRAKERADGMPFSRAAAAVLEACREACARRCAEVRA